VISSYLHCEVSFVKDSATIYVTFLHNYEDFGLPVGIQGPWIVVQSEKVVPIKLYLICTGLNPLLVEGECLLSQFNKIVDFIVVKLRVVQAVHSRLQFVGLIEDIHHFDDLIDLMLLDFFRDHDCDVGLEFLDNFTELIL